MNMPRQPIGYWLKHLDRLIDRAFEQSLGASNLSRRHWQVLNTLIERPVAVRGLAETLEPFIGGDIGALHAIIEDLRARQWIRTLDDGCLAVSDGGRSAHATIMMRALQIMSMGTRLFRSLIDHETRRRSALSILRYA